MADDRERLRELTEQKRRAKAAAQHEREQQHAAAARRRAERRASDEERTGEIRAYCERTFEGYALTQSSHVLRVSCAPAALLAAGGIEAEPDAEDAPTTS
jgi:hypothetical protein